MTEQILTKRIRVYGIVQGVGFRPTTARHAERAGITGTVANKGPYVEIYAQGTERQLRAFLLLLKNDPPVRAAILKTEAKDVTAGPYRDFSIIDSAHTTGEIFIPPDLAICDDCRRELLDPSNRRYLHPFINCTACGPRLTIMEKLPYDRQRTSMKMFPMCPACRKEYLDPASRRFDAQPVCCHDCGPEVYLLEKDGRHSAKGHEAISHVRRILEEGGVVAVKGIGGFHLCCSACDTAAVNRLRERKHRPGKPFAVMLRDEETALRECVITGAQRKILTGHQKPILLLSKREKGTKICEAVAPDNPLLGVMLPYAPIQVLLFDDDDGCQVPDALVMTSGNTAGAPIARDDGQALTMLSDFCDAILSNNRPILIRSDDSVMDFYQDAPYMIRRSRGFAPLPVPVTFADGLSSDLGKSMGDLPDQEKSTDQAAVMDGQDAGSAPDPYGAAYGVTHRRKSVQSILGIGGELKNTFCISRNGLFYPSSYVGDLADVRSGQALEEAVERMLTLLETRPQRIVCDLHPGYRSGAVAQKLGQRYDIPVVRIQHHYAHILSCMAENDAMGPCIGIAMDGTGYGEEEGETSIWGGEILLCTLHGYRRAASVTPFLQTGGDAAAREGWRIAASLIRQCAGTDTEAAEQICRLNLCSRQEAGLLLAMQAQKINTMTSTSAGRLFDAAAAVLGIRRGSTFEGEAATTLMFRAMEWQKRGDGRKNAEALLERTTGFSLRRTPEGRYLLPTDALFSLLLKNRLSYLKETEGQNLFSVRRTADPVSFDANAGMLAYVFHAGLAAWIARCAVQLRAEGAPAVCALSGGCFQNRLLLSMTQKHLEEAGFTVLRHHLIPPNDGGIALGQAVYGAAI